MSKPEAMVCFASNHDQQVKNNLSYSNLLGTKQTMTPHLNVTLASSKCEWAGFKWPRSSWLQWTINYGDVRTRPLGCIQWLHERKSAHATKLSLSLLLPAATFSLQRVGRLLVKPMVAGGELLPQIRQWNLAPVAMCMCMIPTPNFSHVTCGFLLSEEKQEWTLSSYII